MSGKGGKGYSQPKSALKYPASLQGKDDSSMKSKRGRKVQFDSEDSVDGTFAKSSGKANTTTRGDWGKAGKGDKTSKGGKSPSVKEPDLLELKVEGGLAENTICLMDCEASEILQGIQDHMAVLSADAELKMPRGLIYAKRGDHYKSPQAIRQILEPLKKFGVTDGEICLIANICPESVEEVFALVPSLKRKKPELKEAVRSALDELAKQKTTE